MPGHVSSSRVSSATLPVPADLTLVIGSVPPALGRRRVIIGRLPAARRVSASRTRARTAGGRGSRSTGRAMPFGGDEARVLLHVLTPLSVSPDLVVHSVAAWAHTDDVPDGVLGQWRVDDLDVAGAVTG